MSACVMTWMADAVSDNFSGRLETDVTSMSINCSMLSVFSLAADWRTDCGCARMLPVKASKTNHPGCGGTNISFNMRLQISECLTEPSPLGANIVHKTVKFV